MGQERCKPYTLMSDFVMPLMPTTDYIRFGCRTYNARGITRMVPVARRLLLLSGQSVQEVSTLVRKDSRCSDDHFIRSTEVCWLRIWDLVPPG